MNKLHVLILAAAALSAAAWFASHREQQRFGVSEGQLLVAGLSEQLTDIDRVTIHPAGSSSVTLSAEQDQWVVQERDNYPADIQVLRKELRKLAEARTLEAKTAQVALYPQLGVQSVDQAEDTTLRLTAQAGDTEVLDIIIGKPGASGSYVRLLDNPQAWLIDQRISLPRVIVGWLDTQLVSVPRADVQRVAVNPTQGPNYAIVRHDPEQTAFSLEPNSDDGQALNVANVNRLGAALSSLRIQDVVSDVADDLAWSQATLTTFDGLVLKLEVAKSSDNERYLRIVADVREGADESARQQAEAINAKSRGRTFLGPQYSVDALAMRHDMLIRQPANEQDG